MIEIPIPVDSAIVSFVVFAVSFVVLYVIWNLLLRVAESFFSKSRLYFIPQLLKDITYSILLVIFLVSIYFAIISYDPTVMAGTPSKIWGILLIVAIAEVVARIILSTVDFYGTKARGAKTFLSSRIPMLKRTVGLLIYAIAALLIINLLSTEIGSVVMIIALVAILFFFVLYYKQLKNIIAGFQVPDIIDEGDYVIIDGKEGFVESLSDQHIILRHTTGAKFYLPNSMVAESIIENRRRHEGNVVMAYVKLGDVRKAKEKLTAVCGKVALDFAGISHEFSPKISVAAVEEGKNVFAIRLIAMPEADLTKVADALAEAFKKEFKSEFLEFMPA